MKTLYLMRHAKASWDDPGAGDFDRPLNGRGRAAARAMAKHLLRSGIAPGLVLCSAARRTRETLQRLDDALAGAEVSVERGLYEAPHLRLLDRLRQLPEDTERVLVIGHNPGLERLARLLCGHDGVPEAVTRLETKYPTGALATLTLRVARWPELGSDTCRLAAFVKPADLEA